MYSDLTPDIENPRRIRSFVKRAGRMTPSQEHALEHYWPLYGLTLDKGPLNFTEIFGNDHPVIMEIGFGMGDSLSTMAATMPDNNYIGIEVHRPGVGRLLNNLATQDLGNVRVFCDDAIEVMAQCIADESLGGVQLFFPDPWHKKKHHKRRIVQSKFAQDIRQKLAPDGIFHMATDWQQDRACCGRCADYIQLSLIHIRRCPPSPLYTTRWTPTPHTT